MVTRKNHASPTDSLAHAVRSLIPRTVSSAGLTIVRPPDSARHCTPVARSGRYVVRLYCANLGPVQRLVHEPVRAIVDLSRDVLEGPLVELAEQLADGHALLAEVGVVGVVLAADLFDDEFGVAPDVDLVVVVVASGLETRDQASYSAWLFVAVPIVSPPSATMPSPVTITQPIAAGPGLPREPPSK